MAESRLHQLAERGQSVWIDLLSREFVHGGELAPHDRRGRRHRAHLEPVDLPEGDRAGGGDYDEQIARAARRRPTTRARSSSRSRSTTCATPATCCGRSGTRPSGADGYVSLEVDPTLAHDTDGTLEQAIELHDAVDRPNVYIKIPATLEGLPAIEDCDRARRLDQHHADLLARALPARSSRRTCAGSSGSSTAAAIRRRSRRSRRSSSRGIDTETDKRLEALGNTELQGKLGIANAKLAYRHFQEAFAGPRWERARRARARRSSGRSGPRPRPRTRPTAT